MSSIKFDPELSGEHVRNMTMQWDYGNVPAPRREKRREMPQGTGAAAILCALLSPVFNLLSMLAGAATALAILAWASGFLTF